MEKVGTNSPLQTRRAHGGVTVYLVCACIIMILWLLSLEMVRINLWRQESNYFPSSKELIRQQLGSLTLLCQTVYGKVNSEIKPVKFRIKIDLMSHLILAEGLANEYNTHIQTYTHTYIQTHTYGEMVDFGKSDNIIVRVHRGYTSVIQIIRKLLKDIKLYLDYTWNTNNSEIVIGYEIYRYNTNNSEIVIRYQIYVSNTNNSEIVIGYQIYLCNTSGIQIIRKLLEDIKYTSVIPLELK